MEFQKKVQFLSKDVTNNGLYRYSFLDLESNLPFDLYYAGENVAFKEFKEYSIYTIPMKLERFNDKQKGLTWKVKGV